MNIIDLTHLISENMPVYPGTEKPKLTPATTLENDGFRETLLNMYSHTGTHMDTPGHLLEDAAMLDELPASTFVGSALIIDCRDLREGDTVPLSHITRYGEDAEKAEFLLFNFGWDRFWNDEKYFGDYPYLGEDTVDYIIKTKKKGVGLDVIGIDPISDSALSIHKKLFRSGNIVVIENLCNLDKVGSGLFTFAALPLKYENSDGAPVRAIAIK